MKRRLCVAVVVLIVVMAVPGLAGEKEHKKCDGTPDECTKKMTASFENKAWLGIEMDGIEDGHYKITKVIAKSPAEKAGFQEGDILLAMNGKDYAKDNMKVIKMQWGEVKPGAKAKYTVLRQGGTLDLKAELGSLPEEYREKYIQEHLAKFHQEG